MKLAIAGAAVLVCATASMAAPWSARVVRHGVDGDVTLAFRLVDGAGGIDGVDRIAPAFRRVIAADAVSVDLPDGNWAIDTEGDGVWPGRQFVALSAAAPPTVTPTIDVWRAAEIAGRIETAEPRLPKALVIRYANANADVASAPDGDVTCPIVDRAFRCTVPRGAWQLRVKAASMIERYYFDVATPADLGAVKLQRGQSIVGRVELARGAGKDVRNVVIRATPSSELPTRIALTARPAANGAFHIDAVPPGQYQLSASLERSAMSAAVDVIVHRGTDETVARPLIVDRPAEVRVLLVPRLDPDGKPWQVMLEHFASEHVIDTSLELTANGDGVWNGSIPPARYGMRVLSSSGATWHAEPLDVAGAVTVPLLLASRKAHGHLTLGKQPLAATLTFSFGGGEDVIAQSGEDGTFALVLPRRDGKATVVVESEKPVVNRSYDVTFSADDDDAAVDIALPSSIVHGIVVDAAGAGVAGALINIGGGGDVVQPGSAPDGTFAIHGLAAGAYRMQAAAYLQESDVATVNVRDDDTPDVIRLVMKTLKQVRGRVVSDFGPVAGAHVTVRPTDANVLLINVSTTDEAGAFHCTIPPASTEFDILIDAPGFSLSYGHLRYEDKVVVASVEQRGGTLIVDGGANDPALELRHGGARVTMSWLQERTRVDERNAVIAPMEPGVYELCSGATPEQRCASGILPPYGTLTLAARK